MIRRGPRALKRRDPLLIVDKHVEVKVRTGGPALGGKREAEECTSDCLQVAPMASVDHHLLHLAVKHPSMDAVGGRLGVRCQGLGIQGYMPKVIHLLLIDGQQLWRCVLKHTQHITIANAVDDKEGGEGYDVQSRVYWTIFRFGLIDSKLEGPLELQLFHKIPPDTDTQNITCTCV